MKYLTRSEADTLQFAGRLSDMLKAGDSVLLHGDLGAGKSVFARGVARGMGVTGAMPSPTFTLMIPYEGSKKLYHFDLYRLNDPDEFYAAGLDEFIGGDGVALVEWPEMAEIDPVPCLHVTICRGADENEREIEIECVETELDAALLADWRMEN
ncbi:MAG: tRNA (adenosine(37)-N6)-threonylcarbamoyltransferase complex ATPase subunit type 1 TsaE [Clostridia bacterium]|nr:tRNA (adenosine(37)-N6)-threonylcarbamoyltransferase complex ATPase subunit type 1 TsaE [Clostridia bacterium]MBP3652752.1 tRNA (adenosine(37)-N6)-threonylcarbamoyltransferase complex ATPase subunit type 1 TsaE [Clostridia bacterium]